MPIFFVASCKSGVSKTDLLNSGCVSEYRTNLFLGKGENFVVTFTSGAREKDYVMDGKAGGLTDFGVITLLTKFETTKAPQFELKINGDTFVGEFEKNPYDKTFVYDVGKMCGDGDNLSLYVVDCDEKVTLDCVSKNWKCDLQKASNVFSCKYEQEIKLHTKDGCLQGEMYFKLVSSDVELANVYWYALLVCESGDMYACLIDVNTGEIVQN